MISCLVATKEGKWGVYCANEEQLERKELPWYISPFDYPSQVWEVLGKLCKEGESDGHTDYGSFWAKIREAGIEVPETARCHIDRR